MMVAVLMLMLVLMPMLLLMLMLMLMLMLIPLLMFCTAFNLVVNFNALLCFHQVVLLRCCSPAFFCFSVFFTLCSATAKLPCSALSNTINPPSLIFFGAAARRQMSAPSITLLHTHTPCKRAMTTDFQL
jgi:hypothetical protein